MKMLKRIILPLLIVSMLACSLTFFTGCFEGKDNDGKGTVETEALAEAYVDVERGESVDLCKEILNIVDDFEPAANNGGYVSTAQLAADIYGYSEYYTYFSATVTITWTYNEITEVDPTGVDKTFSTTIGLDADGNGHYSNQISFHGCRDVRLVRVDYEFSGTATRK